MMERILVVAMMEKIPVGCCDGENTGTALMRRTPEYDLKAEIPETLLVKISEIFTILS